MWLFCILSFIYLFIYYFFFFHFLIFDKHAYLKCTNFHEFCLAKYLKIRKFLNLPKWTLANYKYFELFKINPCECKRFWEDLIFISECFFSRIIVILFLIPWYRMIRKYLWKIEFAKFWIPTKCKFIQLIMIKV